MATSLRSQLDALAASFADAIFDVLRTTPLNALVEDAAGPRTGAAAQPESVRMPSALATGRLHRRSADEIAAALETIVTLLRSHKSGLRAEQIRGLLGMQSKELPRVLKQGLESRQLRSTGQKRATTYFAG